jgi:hypothetical protein
MHVGEIVLFSSLGICIASLRLHTGNDLNNYSSEFIFKSFCSSERIWFVRHVEVVFESDGRPNHPREISSPYPR